MSDFLEPIGNEEAILQNILGANNELLPPMSRNEKILLDILGEDYPIEPPMSRMEALLIALKEKIEHDTPSGKINITENGNDIDIAQYATADVNVSGGADLGTKSITANGTYAASEDNLDGYSSVTVNVPMPEEYCIGGSLYEKTLTGYHYPSNPLSGSLSSSMFRGCSVLETIENFPSSVTIIPDYFAYDCTKLKNIVLSDNITAINQYAFSKCRTLALKKLPANLTTFGSDAFAYTAIEIDDVPIGVTIIPTSVFYGCEGITKLEIKGNITLVGGSAFQYCSNCLVYDFRHCTGVPTLVSIMTFWNTNANFEVVVPDSLYDTWIVASNWVTYASHIVSESDYTGV